MKLKHFFTSFAAYFDDMVSKVENHEAVAESAIQAARQQIAKIHAQYQLSQNRLNALESRHQQLESKVETWQTRAINYHASDKAKALQCMQALQNTQKEADAVMAQIKETSRLKLELQHHLHEAEQHVTQLQQRKESLVARTAKNNVKQWADLETQESDLQNVFNRWEQNLAQSEYLSGSIGSLDQAVDDQLDFEIESKTSQMALETALDDLIAQQHQENTHD